MRETAKSRTAFDRYARMGDARSLTKLQADLAATGVKVSLRTLESWSTGLHWQPRIAEIEREAAAAGDQQLTVALREMNERQAREGLLLQQKGAEWLTSEGLARIDAEAAIRAITEGARLERNARGGATERIDVRHGEPDHRVEGLDDDQLARLIERVEAELTDEAPARGSQTPAG